MLFNSLQFALFFPLVVLLHFSLPHRFRWMWLLFASYWFYMSWEPRYIVLLIGCTSLAWGTGLLMGRASTPAVRRGWLIAGLAGNLGALFFFKYFNFANDSLTKAAEALGGRNPLPAADVLLPVGISFFVFQALSYSIDVYRGRMQPERHPGHFALYISFFPQLVAGPIERATNLLPQLKAKVSPVPENVVSGLKLMLWGMFKKVVIADRLAVFTDAVYDNPAAHSAPDLILATYFFAFQIFCDFSGYTDIAIGAARVMGYDLMKNFDRPYFAGSVADFWRRWHISLSTWFKDYLYFPLGGNRVAKGRWAMNVLVVFLVSGLWHGAAWTYVIWGALHGLYLVGEDLTAGLRSRIAEVTGLARFPRLRKGIAVFATFHLVLFAWVFFRARTLSDAWLILKTIASGAGFDRGLAALSVSMPILALCLGLIALLEAVHVFQEKGIGGRLLLGTPVAVRWGMYLLLLMGVLNLRPAEVAPFIYFQF